MRKKKEMLIYSKGVSPTQARNVALLKNASSVLSRAYYKKPVFDWILVALIRGLEESYKSMGDKPWAEYRARECIRQ